MILLEVTLLGLLQGVTEFLPVSSSGHLALLQHVWMVPEATRLPLTAMLHVGTAMAVIGCFARRIGAVAAGCFSGNRSERSDSLRLIGFVALGTLPAGLVGVLLRGWVAAAFASPVLIAAMLIVTGAGLFCTRYVRRNDARLGIWSVVLIGIAQAVSILPGVSRSGATIATGLYLGLNRKEAFEFSFLLSLPAVLGGAALELRHIRIGAVDVLSMAVGTVVALISGVLALALLRRAVVGRWFYRFGFYCWLIGLTALLMIR